MAFKYISRITDTKNVYKATFSKIALFCEELKKNAKPTAYTKGTVVLKSEISLLCTTLASNPKP